MIIQYSAETSRENKLENGSSNRCYATGFERIDAERLIAHSPVSSNVLQPEHRGIVCL